MMITIRQRIKPRSLFDLSVGHDNLFHGDRYKWSAQFTVINLTNKYALYNFLSTFSGTHYVTPARPDRRDWVPFLGSIIKREAAGEDNRPSPRQTASVTMQPTLPTQCGCG